MSRQNGNCEGLIISSSSIILVKLVCMYVCVYWYYFHFELARMNCDLYPWEDSWKDFDFQVLTWLWDQSVWKESILISGTKSWTHLRHKLTKVCDPPSLLVLIRGGEGYFLNTTCSRTHETDELNFQTSSKGYGSVFAAHRNPIAITKLVEK